MIALYSNQYSREDDRPEQRIWDEEVKREVFTLQENVPILFLLMTEEVKA